MEQNPLAFPPVGDTVTAACARGKRRRRRPHTATESSRVLQQSRGSGLAWPRGYHLPASAGAIDAWSGAFRRPWWPAREIAPAAARDQHVQQRIHNPAKRGMRHPPPASYRLWGKDVCKELPFQVAQALESACHNPLLHDFKGVWHRISLSGIDSWTCDRRFCAPVINGSAPNGPLPGFLG